MPIYAASLFESRHHHGRRVAVCRSLPKGAVVDRHLRFLAPPADLLLDWNSWKQYEAGITDDHERQYKERYWAHLLSVWDQLSRYLDGLPTDETETWLCWEKPDEFCHRNLLLKVIERDWPQHMGKGGGADVEMAIAAPGIAWACERLGLKPIYTPIVPSTPVSEATTRKNSGVQNRSQLLFFPNASNS